MAPATPDSFEIDPQLLREFLVESLESLAGLDRLFISLEKNPNDHSIIDQIFRPVHSIKGNSAFFGLINVKNFSHAMENILQEIRSHKRNASQPIIDILLRGTDLLRQMLERIEQGNLSTEFLPEEEELLAKFNQVLEGEEAALEDLVSSVRTALHALTELGLDGTAAALVKTAREAFSQIAKTVAPGVGSSSGGSEADLSFFLGDQDVTEDIGLLTSFIRNVITDQKDAQKCDVFQKSLHHLIEISKENGHKSAEEPLEALLSDFTTIHSSGIGFDELMASLLRERQDQFLQAVESREIEGTTVTPQEAPAEQNAEKAEEPKKEDSSPTQASKSTASQKADASAAGKTLRIAEEKVDGFMSYVGELIIAGEVFAYIQKKLELYPDVRTIAQEFKNANISFNELSTNLQKSLMSVRRVPLRSVLQKMPRIVRDIITQNGKDVELTITGEDIQIDKSLLEGLENPLVHMIRNSVDHGIETPEERADAGKAAKGHVWVEASADEETFKIKIKDDGKGLDVEAIKAKAVEKENITADRARKMTDQEAYQLIFGAGVSTAKKVTDISGRGVGMDVVRSNILALNGNITIESEIGKGTTFTILLPMTVTLMVVDGLVARVGTESYIIPLVDVKESIRPTKDQVFTVSGKGEMLDVRGELYRLIRTYEMLGVEPETKDITGSTVILIEQRGLSCGLMVDEVVGQQSVVLKDLGKQFSALEIIQGGAILGDGRVGLVFDTEGIMHQQGI